MSFYATTCGFCIRGENGHPEAHFGPLPEATDCEHPLIDAYRFDDPTHESFGMIALWACRICRRRFEPVTPKDEAIALLEVAG